MRLTFLGTGSIIPTVDRFSSAILLEIENDRLLLDCGPGTLEKLRMVRVDPNTISRVFLTHYHIDHVLDLPAIVKVRAFDRSGGPSLSPLCLRVYGPPGLNIFVNHLFKEIAQFRYLSENLLCFRYLKLKEVTKGLVDETSTWRVTCTPVKHYGGVAYKIEAENKSIVYSGDTIPDENLIEFAMHVDVLIHECSFPDEQLLGLHTSEKGLAKVAAKVRPRLLIPVHLYPAWEGREEELKTSLTKAFGGSVIVPKDLESYEI